MDTQELWKTALGELELQLSKANFTTWFRDTFIADVNSEQITIAVPNNFTKAWLENKYQRSILQSLRHVTNDAVRTISFKVESRAITKHPPVQNVALPTFAHESEIEQSDGVSQQEAVNQHSLNPRYTFENYIVGKQNEFAHAASRSVAKSPGHTYNPLYIYGGVGLGKTHLLQAIGHAVLKEAPHKKVLYVTSEKFTNDFINAIRVGTGRDFKEAYRNVDVFIVDDIQFFSGKVETQEEFFHTFNTLHNANKQIVLSSDRPPKAIAALESRLLSRFEQGMTADISSPDFETRVAILETKCRDRQWIMSMEILHFIAENIVSNVRELEGALNKIIAYHQLKNHKPTLESVEPIITSFKPIDIIKSVTPRELIHVVAAYFDITPDDVVGKSREKRLAFPRQIIMYLMRDEMSYSYPSIGTELGGRDHTTAMHAFGKIRDKLERDDKLKHDIEIIKQRLYAGA